MAITNYPTEYNHSYILTAGESNACGRMPLTLVTERVIEVSTEHANALGIGYAALITKNMGWVLSRLSIEMYRYPEINDHYTITTWIETYNRHFSERNLVMTAPDGSVFGYMRTVWVAMDFASRTIADLTSFEKDAFPTADLECPIAPTPRMAPLGADAVEEAYTFRYCDIDFNRHVNTVRYLALILNHWSLDHYDRHTVGRLDLMFRKECHFGEEVLLRTENSDENHSACEIVRNGERLIDARIKWNKIN